MNDRKKLLKQNYKNSNRTMGVYQIRNLRNEKVLIGSSLDLNGIFNRNRFQLQMGSHPNRTLQNDWNELGEDGFAFEVAEELLPRQEAGYNYRKDLESLEDLWCEKIRPFGKRGYNERKKTRGERLQMISNANRERRITNY